MNSYCCFQLLELLINYNYIIICTYIKLILRSMHSINFLAHCILILFVSFLLSVYFHLVHLVSFNFLASCLWFNGLHWILNTLNFLSIPLKPSDLLQTPNHWCYLIYPNWDSELTLVSIIDSTECLELPVNLTPPFLLTANLNCWWYLICPNWDSETTTLSIINSTWLHQFCSTMYT